MDVRHVLAFVTVCFVVKLYCTACTLTQEIKIQQGSLTGCRSLINNYDAYLGLPYGTVVKRFQEAVPAPTWNGTFLAIQGSVQCNQFSEQLNKPVGREDCLVSNIFTPIDNKNITLPVMVFIHGGGFYGGSNNVNFFDPKYFVKKDVVVVVINYRVGAFGFLCVNGTEASGNFGLKDQVLALKWVVQNIGAFGGNPNSITVFGESAGAAAIHFLILSEKYKGIFNRAILQSGSVLEATMFDNSPIETAKCVVAKMGYKTSDPKGIVNIFQNASPDDIVKASYVSSKNNAFGKYVFRPCAENPNDEKALITKSPRKLLKETKIDPSMEIIVGFNNKEGIMWAADYDSCGLIQLNQTFDRVIPDNIIFRNREEKLNLTQRVKNFYFNNGVIGENSYDGLINFFTDSIIAYPSTIASKYFVLNNVTLYNYYFEYGSTRNIRKLQTRLASKSGASHADELFYLFDGASFKYIVPNYNDLKVIDAMTSFWTSFAKTGKPTAKNLNWIKSTKEILKFEDINKEINMISLPNKDRMLFWNKIYNEYSSF